jgi:hypothetical protein
MFLKRCRMSTGFTWRYIADNTLHSPAMRFSSPTDRTHKNLHFNQICMQNQEIGTNEETSRRLQNINSLFCVG